MDTFAETDLNDQSRRQMRRHQYSQSTTAGIGTNVEVSNHSSKLNPRRSHKSSHHSSKTKRRRGHKRSLSDMNSTPNPFSMGSDKLSVIALDIDRTLICSTRSYGTKNPYSQYKVSCEGYFYFSLGTVSTRNVLPAGEITSSSPHQLTPNDCPSTSFTRRQSSQSQTLRPPVLDNIHNNGGSGGTINNGVSGSSHLLLSSSSSSVSQFNCDNPNSNHSGSDRSKRKQYFHVYIRPGVKNLFLYLRKIQKQHGVKIVVASMGAKNYVHRILRELRKHCGKSKSPHFDAILTRQDWDISDAISCECKECSSANGDGNGSELGEFEDLEDLDDDDLRLQLDESFDEDTTILSPSLTPTQSPKSSSPSTNSLGHSGITFSPKRSSPEQSVTDDLLSMPAAPNSPRQHSVNRGKPLSPRRSHRKPYKSLDRILRKLHDVLLAKAASASTLSNSSGSDDNANSTNHRVAFDLGVDLEQKLLPVPSLVTSDSTDTVGSSRESTPAVGGAANNLSAPPKKCEKCQLLMVDDDLGMFAPEDRVSGSIFNIEGWQGPMAANCQKYDPHDLDTHLDTVESLIRAVLERYCSLQTYFYECVIQVLDSNNQRSHKFRQSLLKCLMVDVGVDIDEETALASLWMLDSFLSLTRRHKSSIANASLQCDYLNPEYVEALFACVIIYHLYKYNIYPSAHLQFIPRDIPIPTHNSGAKKHDPSVSTMTAARNFWQTVVELFLPPYQKLISVLRPNDANEGNPLSKRGDRSEGDDKRSLGILASKMIYMVRSTLDKLFPFSGVCFVGSGALQITPNTPKPVVKYYRALTKIYRAVHALQQDRHDHTPITNTTSNFL